MVVEGVAEGRVCWACVLYQVPLPRSVMMRMMQHAAKRTVR